MAIIEPKEPCDIVEAFHHLREAANGAFDHMTGPPCSNCELPVDTSDPDHQLLCGCILCQLCLDRGRAELFPHSWECKGTVTRR